MLKFEKGEGKKLKEILYNSYIHDARIESIRYAPGEELLKIETFNPIFNVKIDITFCEIVTVLAIKKDDFGCRDTIASLTAEEDFSYLQKYIKKYGEDIKESLYLLFQMFSGDELHIVSKEVIIDII